MNMNLMRDLVVAYSALLIPNIASAYYAAHMGRFTNRDPAGEVLRFGGATAQPALRIGHQIPRDNLPNATTNYVDGPNLYQYVGSNPARGVDPSGLYWGSPYASNPYGPDRDTIPIPIPAGSSPSSGPSLYCYYLVPGPGHSAPADPWYLNWGSEIGGAVAIGAGGAAAAGPTITVGTGGCFKIYCRRLGTGIRRDPAHHRKPHGHWHFPWNWGG